MGWLRKKFKEAKSEAKEEWRHRTEVRREEKLSRRSERLMQAEKIGKKKAQLEASQKIKGFKERQKRRSKGFEFKGFAGPTQSKPNMGLGVADYLTGGTNRQTTKQASNPLVSDLFPESGMASKPRRRKRRKKKGGGKSITIKVG